MLNRVDTREQNNSIYSISRHGMIPGVGGGGGTLIFSYIRRLESFFGQTFEFQCFFGVFRKINVFWGMKIL